MPQKSRMWFYFKRIDEGTVSCNLCHKHIKSSGNTSNMMKHLNMHNKSDSPDKDMPKELRPPTKKEKKSTENVFYNFLSSRSQWLEFENPNNTDGSNPGTSYEAADTEKSVSVGTNTPPLLATIERISSYSDSKDRHMRISNAILYFICVDNQPFTTIQCKGFRHLMKELAPLYKIPDKDTIKKRLDEKYDVMVQVFKQKLSAASYVTITTDIWTETTSSKSYLGVTVHFITNELRKLESGNIEIVELPERTENHIRCILLSALMKWNIDINKVVAVVTNNESTMVNAVTQTFGQDKHILCFAHTINLVVENSINNCEGLGSVIDQVRKVVKFVKNSVYVTNKLHQRQIDLGTPENENKKLILDSESRWSSTFYMIERFIELWNVVNEVLYMKHEIPGAPTAEDLDTLKEILDLLRPLEFVTQECSTDKYLAISKMIPLISCIMIEYNKMTQTKQLSRKLKQVILEELEKRLGRTEFVRSASLATILDPRFKNIHFQNAQAMSDAMYLLRDTINKLSNASSSGESDTEQEKSKYDLWIHHRLLANMPKDEDDEALKDELSLYLASPLATLKDNPLEKWESTRTLYPTLYKVAIKYLSIVATSVPADSLFSKTGLAGVRSRNQLADKRLHKLLFLNSVDPEYWFQ
ncbi:zinc finger BED domain-containing protein 4 isoform X2 [Harpegnathos saltator]|uniref:zinc finger BED domain-containing protein 4 isoform X2 n=1 Tax=Harpegnathos saltator TaxID=610380 RepID=UPI00058EF2FA|nr:zinc finger BED domain-containing protein 4 isoform X2 [Harpegnathos saltator]